MKHLTILAIAALILSPGALEARPSHHGTGFVHYFGDSPARMFSLPREGSPDVRRTENRLGVRERKAFDGAPTPIYPPGSGVSIK